MSQRNKSNAKTYADGHDRYMVMSVSWYTMAFHGILWNAPDNAPDNLRFQLEFF